MMNELRQIKDRVVKVAISPENRRATAPRRPFRYFTPRAARHQDRQG
ncbi:MAG TPA: hypothetical protein VM492_14295 [Sumerlaeia bacterium]|nr:hypothetical protein [Sumerlaeia bacterium]